MKIRWTLVACLALMTSCGKEIPGDIIQPEMMEKVLYDYHLTLGMGQNSKNTEKEAFKNYLFQKYQITQAEFDSSMVWYTRESKELTSIYENLDRRFEREHAHYEHLLDIRDQANSLNFDSGDTVNIWRKGAIHWMAENPLNKQLVFEIKPDTTFHEKDAFRWDMYYDFFKEGKAVMGLNVVYENDSIIGETKLVDTSGHQSIYLHTDSTFKVKQLNGFIYVQEDSVQKDPVILIHGITLNRYHYSNATDSLSTTSQPVEQEEKLSEQEQRKLERTKKRLDAIKPSRTEKMVETEERE